nr:glycoside hydrolase family 97 catalytic domain-containing protein [Halomarina rubra]
MVAASAYSATIPAEVAAQVTSGDDSDVQSVSSPDGSITVTVDVSTGVPTYAVSRDGTDYIDQSPIGFDFANQAAFGTAISGSGPAITVTGSERDSATETWDPVWGDFDTVAEEYRSLRLGLEETASPGRSANLELRVFDSGLGFRVVFDQEFGDFTVTSENTEWRFGEDYTSWWIENEFTNPRFEQEYRETALSAIPAGAHTTRPNDNSVRRGAHTPLTMRASDGTHLSVHESNLDDYASMSLAAVADGGGTRFATELAPLPDGTKVQASAPHTTPWRTLQIGDSPGDLVESQLIPLLADPLDASAFPGGDTSWLEDGRSYVGIWWLMIAGSANWQYKSDSQVSSEGGDPAKYIHGARTERMKRYMRFANEHGIESVLAEGWNQGWSTYPGDGTGFEMGVADSYPDFDVPEVTNYGASLPNPVEMTIHNETAGNVVTYEDEIQTQGIFAEYEAEGIRSIKNGYVKDPGLGFEGDGATASHNQHCQTAVNHHRLVMQAAASNRQMLEIHEGIKPTGEIRTYPNVAAREVVKAQEYDGFGELGADVGDGHHVTLPFTRMLAGPTSYQPGIFDLTFEDNDDARIRTTLAKQLAMYPTYLGGLQMAADRIEAYVDHTFEVGQFVQAQSGKLDGTITADTWRDAFGGHYVPIDPSREPEGATARFTVRNVPSAGTYDLHLRYAADQEDNRTEVQTNGTPQATLVVNDTETSLTPPFTDYWDDWAVHTVSVDLVAGTNRLGIELGSGDVGGFNLNTVGVTEPGAGAPFPAAYTDFSETHAANENFDTVPAFEFVENVPVSWDETVAVDGRVGDYSVTAKRRGDEWFLGAMTDESARDLTVSLDFLAGRSGGWTVVEYADAPETGVDNNPTSVVISDYDVAAGDDVDLSLGSSGGTALHIVPAASGDGANFQSGETYVLRNVNSGKALDVASASASDGANVHQYGYVGDDNQKWVVTDLNNGYYKLEAVHSGKALDVEAASTSDGANVHQYGYVGADNQQWEIVENADGSYRLLARHSGKALDVEYASTSDGANVHQYGYGGADNQKWTFERL